MNEESFDYTHSGIANLLQTAVNPRKDHAESRAATSQGGSDQGLHVLYLTSRPISIMETTRRLLRGIAEVDVRASSKEKPGKAVHLPKTGMPQGPIMCSPESTFNVLYAELITHSADQGKSHTLQNVASVFRKAGRRMMKVRIISDWTIHACPRHTSDGTPLSLRDRAFSLPVLEIP
eukprot:scaffold2141_cov282-Pinguiococcus_pyrenoidosus.AAC.6